MKLLVAGFFVLTSAIVAAQDVPNVQATWEQVFTSGTFLGPNKTRDRFSRFGLKADKGPFQVVAHYWAYPFCGWYDLDETYAAYSVNSDLTFRVGRFYLPLNQNGWDRMWYSGFTFVPNLYLHDYSGRKIFERTTPGATAEFQSGATNFQAGVFDQRAKTDRPLASKYDTAFAKVSHYVNGATIGASYLSDLKRQALRERLFGLDFRYAAPRWSAVGEWLSYSSTAEKVDGYLLEGAYRPVSKFDYTLHARFEDMRGSGTAGSFQTWTLGASVRAPFDSKVYVNYTGGGAISRTPLGKQWSISVLKTLNF